MVVINIDTSKDSPEEIRKTIKYLQSVVGDESSRTTGTPGFINPFAEEPSISTTTSEPVSQPASGEMLGMFDNPFQPENDAADSGDEDAGDAASLIASADEVDADGYEMSSDEAEVVEEDSSDAYIEIVEF